MATLSKHVMALALACGILAQEAKGQSAVPGDRVRVRQMFDKRVLVQGTLVRLFADSATIVSNTAGASVDSTTRTNLVVRHNRLEKSEGKKKSTAKGVSLGFFIGAVTGAVLSEATHNPTPCSEWCFFSPGRGSEAIGGALVGGVAGMVVGGIVGSRMKHESWQTVRALPVYVGVAPTANRGIQLTARASF